MYLICILLYVAACAAILYGFNHEDAVIAFEDRVRKIVKEEINRKRAQKLTRDGFAVTRIPQDCSAVVTFRVRK